VELEADLVEEEFDEVEIGGVVGAGVWQLLEPVGEAAVAGFAVIPGAGPQPDVHTVLGAELDEVAKVAAAAPVEVAFDLFVVDPDDVGGDDVDAGGLHLEDLVLPLRLGEPGEVEFAHDREPGLAVEHKIAAIHLERVAVGGDAAEMEVAGLGSGDRGGGVDGDEILSGRGLRDGARREGRGGKNEVREKGSKLHGLRALQCVGTKTKMRCRRWFRHRRRSETVH